MKSARAEMYDYDLNDNLDYTFIDVEFTCPYCGASAGACVWYGWGRFPDEKDCLVKGEFDLVVECNICEKDVNVECRK